MQYVCISGFVEGWRHVIDNRPDNDDANRVCTQSERVLKVTYQGRIWAKSDVYDCLVFSVYLGPAIHILRTASTPQILFNPGPCV